MTFLQPIEERGYPADYLFARLRGRRAALPAQAGEDPWITAQREQAWVFARMNGTLRQIFSPYFRYLELRTLLLCLRNAAAGEAQRNEAILASSLLSRKLKEKLLAGSGPAALAAAERALLALDHSFRGVAAIHARSGARAFEQAVTDRLLRQTQGAPLHPVLRNLFASLVDLRNLLALHKARRWKGEGPPPLLEGGRLAQSALDRLVGAETDVEQAFLDGLGRRLRREGRDPLGVGAILDYLWRCQTGGRTEEERTR